MDFKFLLSFCLMIGGSLGNELKLYNNCPFSVWPRIQGNPGNAHLEDGGFKLNVYQAHVIDSPNNWRGRIWARTQCDGSGHCATGDDRNGSLLSVSLVEVNLTFGGLDFYSISVNQYITYFCFLLMN